MLEEKRKRLRIINIVFFIILAAVSLFAYFLPLNGLNVLSLEMRYPGLTSGPALVWYLFFITLILLGMFTRFQAGNMQHRDNITAKTLDTIGWTFSGAALLYSLAIVLWHYERLGFALFFFILTMIVLMIANGNIRDNFDVMDEKLWVRNPISFFLGWVLFMMMTTIGMRWNGTFRGEMPSLLLFLAFLGFVFYYAFANMNIGVPVLWILIILAKLIQNTSTGLFRYALWGGLAILAAAVFMVARKGPHQQYYRKPVNRAMDKYNYGEESQLEKLEDELNEDLDTKPGGKIKLK